MLTRTGPTDEELTVPFLIEGTAEERADYKQLPRVAKFLPGRSEVTLWVSALEDYLVDPGETVVLRLASTSTFRPGSGSPASMTVVDSGNVPSIVEIADRDDLEGEWRKELNPRTIGYGSGAVLAWSAEGLPPGLAIDSATGRISGTIDFGASRGGRAGTYDVAVRVTDGSRPASARFAWRVDGMRLTTDRPVADEGGTVELSGEFFAAPDSTVYSLDIAWNDGGEDVRLDPVAVTHGVAQAGKPILSHFTASRKIVDDGIPDRPRVGEAADPANAFGLRYGNATTSDSTRIAARLVESRATDIAGRVLEGGASLLVENVPPSAIRFRPVAAGAGGASDTETRILIDIADPGVMERFHVRIDWGDGTPVQKVVMDSSRSVGHTYANRDGQPGHEGLITVYRVTVTATDDDDLTNPVSASEDLHVRSRPPELRLSWVRRPDSEGDRGIVQAEVRYGSASSWGDVRLNWGDGTTSTLRLVPTNQSGVTHRSVSGEGATHLYSNNNGFGTDGGYRPFWLTASLSSTSEPDAPALTDDIQAPVENVRPYRIVPKLEVARDGNDRNEVTLSGTFTDPGLLDPHTVTIHWGDGSSQTASVESLGGSKYGFGGSGVSHTYGAATGKNYLIRVEVSDDHPSTKGQGTVLFSVAGRNLDGLLEGYHEESVKALQNADGFWGSIVRAVGQGFTSIWNYAKEQVSDFVKFVGTKVKELRKLGAAVAQFGDSAVRFVGKFLERPLGTLTRLLEGFKAGTNDFFHKDKIAGNLKDVAVEWVAGNEQLNDLNDFGIAQADLPTNFGDFAQVSGFLLKVTGLSWDQMMATVGSQLSEEEMAILTQAYGDLVRASNNNPPAEDLDADIPPADGGSLGDQSKMITALAKLSSSLNIQELSILNSPEAFISDAALGAVGDLAVPLATEVAKKIPVYFVPGLNLLDSITKTAKWLGDNIGGVADGVGSVGGILDAAGVDTNGQTNNIPEVGNKVVATFKSFGKLVLGFAATQLGVTKIAAKFAEGLGKFRTNKLEAGIGRLVGSLKGFVKGRLKTSQDKLPGAATASTDYRGLVGKAIAVKGPAVGGTPPKSIDRLWATYANKEVVIRTGVKAKPVETAIGLWKAKANKPGPGLTAEQKKEFKAAIAVVETKIRELGHQKLALQSRMPKYAAAKSNYLKEKDKKPKPDKAQGLRTAEKAYMKEVDENRKLTNDLMAKQGDGDLLRAIATCSKYMEGCFAAGTMLRTPTGLKAIEEFVAGDEVLSQDEHDPRSGIVARRVEEVFRRYAPVLGVHLRREGEESPLVIRSTGEHPFYVSDPVHLGRWVAAGDLQAGMWVLCDDGAWARVEEVHDPGEWEVVYNMRVADSHTYFVGEAGRGYAVWVHNTYETLKQALIAKMPEGDVPDLMEKLWPVVGDQPEFLQLLKAALPALKDKARFTIHAEAMRADATDPAPTWVRVKEVVARRASDANADKAEFDEIRLDQHTFYEDKPGTGLKANVPLGSTVEQFAYEWAERKLNVAKKFAGLQVASTSTPTDASTNRPVPHLDLFRDFKILIVRLEEKDSEVRAGVQRWLNQMINDPANAQALSGKTITLAP